jgi:excisionase family DNA binding protein
MTTYTVAQASRLLGISRKSLYRWCGDGLVPHIRLGRAIRLRSEDVELIYKRGLLKKEERPIKTAPPANHCAEKFDYLPPRKSSRAANIDGAIADT